MNLVFLVAAHQCFTSKFMR